MEGVTAIKNPRKKEGIFIFKKQMMWQLVLLSLNLIQRMLFSAPRTVVFACLFLFFLNDHIKEQKYDTLSI